MMENSRFSYDEIINMSIAEAVEWQDIIIDYRKTNSNHNG